MLSDHIYCGDAADVLKDFEDDSVDLIVTSPPYADARKNTYGGIHPDEYVRWFLPIGDELNRVLKPRGSFVLNIKEKVHQGERHPYVMELVLALTMRGWKWMEEYMWHKRNCFPGRWSNRFRDAWEHLHHFTRAHDFAMYQDAVMQPVSESNTERLGRLCANDMVRREPAVGSGFGRRYANMVGRDMVYPTNVLHLATECKNRGHSAAFPEAIPEFFIKLFTVEGDTVLDPFMGSGSTAAVAARLGRHYVGIEKCPEYVEIAESRINKVRVQRLKE
jgi:DNA modification methylase